MSNVIVSWDKLILAQAYNSGAASRCEDTLFMRLGPHVNAQTDRVQVMTAVVTSEVRSRRSSELAVHSIR